MSTYDFGKGPCIIKNIISSFNITKESVKFNKICAAFRNKYHTVYDKSSFSLIKRNLEPKSIGLMSIEIGLKYSTGPLIKFLIFKSGKIIQSGHNSDEYGRLTAMKLCIFITYHTWIDCDISMYRITNIIASINLNNIIDLSRIKDRYGDKANLINEEFHKPILVLRDVNDSVRLIFYENGLGIICGIKSINDIESNYHLMHEIASTYHN